jgi:hypothetical protein
MAALPDKLRKVLQPMIVWTDNTGYTTLSNKNLKTKVTSTTDYLPLLSEFEFFGNNCYANTNESTEQEQYSFFARMTSDMNREEIESLNGIQNHIGYGYDGMPLRSIWFRSPAREDSQYFCMAKAEIVSPQNANWLVDRLSSYGDMEQASCSLGVAPIFTV